ncbi:MAG: hypothetical protein P8Y45_02310, partial [Exilibacterium sp.]
MFAVQNSLKIVSQQVVLLLPLILNNGFRGTTKGLGIATGSRLKQLPKYFTVCHFLDLSRLAR